MRNLIFCLCLFLVDGCGNAFNPSSPIEEPSDGGTSNLEILEPGVYIGRCEMMTGNESFSSWGGDTSGRSFHIVACDHIGPVCPIPGEDCQGCEHLPNEDFLHVSESRVDVLCGEEGKFLFQRVMLEVR